jgi:hypothetical protein
MDQTTSKLHSQAFDLLRFPLTILVVCEHLFEVMEFRGVRYSSDDYPVVYVLMLIKKALFSGANVPLFFLISGFLFFYNVDFSTDVYKRKIRSRVKTLLVPYIVWNTLAILRALLPLVPGVPSSLFSYSDPDKLNLSFLNILSCYWYNYPGIYTDNVGYPPFPINFPLWYIRDLMIAVVFAPAVYYMIKRFKRSVILLFGAVWFIFFNMNQEVIAYFRMTCISSAFFFFYWGAYMSINRVNMPEVFGRFFTPSVVVYVSTCALYILSVCYFPACSSFIHWFTICSFVFVAYNVAVWLLRHNLCHVNRFLVGGSFFVYVAHALILSYVEKAFLMALHPADNFSLFAVYMLTLVTTVLSLLAFYYLLKHFASPELKVLTGRC